MRPWAGNRSSASTSGELGDLLHDLAARRGGEVVPDVTVDEVHIDWVMVLPTGVFVVGGEPIVLAEQRAALAGTVPVRVESVVAVDPTSLTRAVVGTSRSPRPHVLDESAIGRIAARIRLGGVVRIIGG